MDNFSATSVSQGLCETSLRGVDSHGIKLLYHYVNSALKGRKNPRPKFYFKKKFPSLGVLNADNAFGHSAGMKAIDLGIRQSQLESAPLAITMLNLGLISLSQYQKLLDWMHD